MFGSFTLLYILLQIGLGLLIIYFIYQGISKSKSTPLIFKIIGLVIAGWLLFRITAAVTFIVISFLTR